MFDLQQVQAAIESFGMDGWLLYDFRGINLLASRVVGIADADVGSRRWFYYVPRSGQPRKLVHRIEPGALDHLPGAKTVYLRWQQLEDGVRSMLQGAGRVAMEYSPRNGNPYVSRVDGGTIELVRSMGVDIVSSGDLVQFFEARWSDAQWQAHLQADTLNQQAFQRAWQMIADHVRRAQPLRETDVQQMVMDFYAAQGMTTYHPPIVGVGPHSADPHYSPARGADSQIAQGDFVLLDMWAKMDSPDGVYSDITKVGFVGTQVPAKYNEVFSIVAAARDAGIQAVRQGMTNGQPLFGWQVDDATRAVIQQAGYGEYFCHRTGHNIGKETHGNGAHIDNLETREDRRILPQTCFSIEPGIYLDEFGIRSEVNVFVDGDGGVTVTGGPQSEVLPVMAEF